MPTKTNRTERIPLRATPGEKTRMTERANDAGLTLSAWIRRAALEGVLPAARKVSPAPKPLPTDYEQRVKKMALRMPRKTAERLVRREMEEEAA